MGKVAGEQELALQQHFPYANGEVNAHFMLTIQRSLVLLSAFMTLKLCRAPFQIWMNGHDITTSNLELLNVKS